jgi:CDP-diacylglycerol--serine O-phosphatidyltransferase
LVTTANLFFGFYSIILSIKGQYEASAWALVFAGVFDGLDGRVARMAKATSEFGVEYDSLCDLVSFGVAPGLLLYLWVLTPLDELAWLISFLFLACGALRLARFNVTEEVLPKGFFQGLPIPAGAMGIVSFYLFQNKTQFVPLEWLTIVGAVWGVILALFMVSSIPFPSFKELNWRSRVTFGYFFVGVIAMIAVIRKPDYALFVIMITYLMGALAWNLVRKIKVLFFGFQDPISEWRKQTHVPKI